MAESKILKARCTKTGRHFAMELRSNGSEWKVVNFIDLTGEEASVIMSEVKQPVFKTNDNLLACYSCGSRKVGGCSCPRRACSCSENMKYKFDCIYCDKLEIDYSRTHRKTPYTKWAGTSNIPDAIKDRYGNPQGCEYDLVEDDSFEGYKIVLLNFYPMCNFDQPAEALRKKGFVVEEYKTLPALSLLEKAVAGDRTQLWIISDRTSYLNNRYLKFIRNYFESGHGVYIWGDNDPFYADANLILEDIFGTSMSGDYIGDQVIGIQRKVGDCGITPNHPITTGIVNFYEGITIANVRMVGGLEPLVYSSDHKVVTAFYDRNERRALIDGGFTRLYYKWDSAGTDRYIVNAAAWLANIEKFGYYQ